MATNEVWRRVVFIRWKEKATRGEVARAMNVHKSFPRAIPCVISVAEGMTCTSMVDGGGCYPGVGLDQQNRGFHSAIEIILACSSPEDVTAKYFQHPAHVSAAEIVDPLIEDAWAMDWREDHNALTASPLSVMKHICFFKWEAGTTKAEQRDLFREWKGLVHSMDHCVAVSCGEAVRWAHGEKRGFDAGLVVDLALTSCDGMAEISDYAFSDEYQKINDGFLAPIRKDYVVMDFAEHRLDRIKMETGATSKL